MKKSIVIHKINKMPEGLLGIVSDFLDKLVEGYKIGLNENSELSETEKKEILIAISEYEANPDNGIDWKKLKNELSEKYEI